MRPTEEWLRANFKVSEIGPKEARCFCPLHKDKNRASLYINLASGAWKCHGGCGAGALSTLCKRTGKPVPPKASSQEPVRPVATPPTKYVPMQEVVAAEKLLWSPKGKNCRAYFKERGINDATLKKFRVGLDAAEAERAWLPVFDHTGGCVNVRRYDWIKTSPDKYRAYGAGYGEERIWPAGVVERNEEVILFEGETDCLLAHSLGIDNAITTTGGAGGWEPHFTRCLAGKHVMVCYDIDDAGRSGAAAVARALSVTSRATVVHLPISQPKNGDFTDYVRSVGFDRRTVLQFFGDARARPTATVGRSTFAGLASLDPAAAVTHSLRAVVSGKDLTPFNVPAAVKISCVPNGKSCQACPLLAGGGDTTVQIPLTSKVVLKSVLASDVAVSLAIDEHCKIPARCPGHQQDIVKSQPLWDLRLSPDVDSMEEEGSEGSRRAFSMANLTTNTPYELTMVACSDPKTQYALLHILEAKSSLTSLDAWTIVGKEALLKLWEP